MHASVVVRSSGDLEGTGHRHLHHLIGGIEVTALKPAAALDHPQSPLSLDSAIRVAGQPVKRRLERRFRAARYLPLKGEPFDYATG
jgi:hypothetical protein